MKGKVLSKAVIVNASVEDVWNAWTTSDGIKTFFARECNMELRLNGGFEVYFSMTEPEGSRGSEGCVVLSYLPEKMLSFSWNAPPHFPEIRNERTWVVVLFNKLSSSETQVLLNHLGWKEGKLWGENYAYFESAWNIVLNRLKERFISGPIKWQ